jgi:hypothetical protein
MKLFFYSVLTIKEMLIQNKNVLLLPTTRTLPLFHGYNSAKKTSLPGVVKQPKVCLSKSNITNEYREEYKTLDKS